MSWSIVIRRARPEDERKRAALVQCGLNDHFRDAFLLFLFQEFTLQCVVLAGAVLFIFAGASITACCLVLPAAAAIVYTAVYVTHTVLADKQLQGIRKEMSGWVAEARGPLGADPPPAYPPPRLYTEVDARRLLDGDAPKYIQVVGTVSLSEFWGPNESGWLHALAVDSGWRRRGVGRALVTACRAAAGSAGLRSLEALTSEIQHEARALLHAQGWELRGSYRRTVVGAAVTLQMAQLGIDLAAA